MIVRFLLALLISMPSFINGVEYSIVQEAFNKSRGGKPLFNYPLNITILQGSSNDEDVMVMLHGYGSNHTIAESLQPYKGTSNHLIAFDFPDHDAVDGCYDVKKSTFGSVQEILPLLYILKILAIDAHAQTINLYGFSMGGGALVNAIAALNTSRYNGQLEQIGISSEDKKAILKSIQNGWILLDAPLKSMEECIAASGNSYVNAQLAKKFRINNSRPIDSLKYFQRLNLNVIVYFEVPDEAVANRDDDIFFKRLQQYNPNGNNYLLKGTHGGHCSYHQGLWKLFKQVK